MSREGSLIKNTFIITIGKICTQLMSFLLLPLYTAVLTTTEYGVVDLLNTIVSLLLPIVTLQVDQALFRELIEARHDEIKQSKIISTGLLTVSLQCIAYMLVFIGISAFIHNQYKYFLVSNVISNIYLSALLQISRGLGNNKKYAIASFISASFTIVLNVFFLVLGNLGARGMLLATLFGQVLACLYLFFLLKLHRKLRVRNYKFLIVKQLWMYSIPLIPNAISWWIIDASDRVIVSTFLGVEQNGILAASLKFASLLTSVNYIFTLSWTESIALAIEDEDISTYFNKMVNVILGVFISIAFGMITCMPIVFPLLINNKYIDGYRLVPISIFATLFNVIVGLVSAVYVAKKNTKAIAKTSVFAAVINIITHLCLIKYIGLYAAVISSFIAFGTMAIYRIMDVNKHYLPIELDKRTILSSLITASFILIAYYINNAYLYWVSFFVSVLFAWLINKNSLGLVWYLVKRKQSVKENI